MNTTTGRQPRFTQGFLPDAAAMRRELSDSLLDPRAHLAPKFLYDALGSKLFDAITELPEYYLTRTEAAIVEQHGVAIGQALGTGSTLIDLGAGNCAKAARWFPILKPTSYVAVDISVEFLRQSLMCLQREHPQMDLHGIGCDFSANLVLPADVGPGPRTVFFPGSSIGNFTPEQARAFLVQAHRLSQGGGLLIGVDFVKPRSIVEPAYDDALGVTAAFNLNLLLHVNRLLGSNFALADWQHVAFFDEAQSRIEMHLQARRAVQVGWPGGERRFAAGERIHTENSYKYRPDVFYGLIESAGFHQILCWTDPAGRFGVFAAAAR